jgi:hypothetical protein
MSPEATPFLVQEGNGASIVTDRNQPVGVQSRAIGWTLELCLPHNLTSGPQGMDTSAQMSYYEQALIPVVENCPIC